MKKLIMIILVVFAASSISQATKTVSMEDNRNKLAVIWTSGDPEVAEKVCFMYTYNAKKQGWFEEVTLIIWGPSSKLLAENKMLQDYVKKMQDAGVKVQACINCANLYGVADDLRKMNIEVKGMGIPLTNYLKEGWHTLTF